MYFSSINHEVSQKPSQMFGFKQGLGESCWSRYRGADSDLSLSMETWRDELSPSLWSFEAHVFISSNNFLSCMTLDTLESTFLKENLSVSGRAFKILSSYSGVAFIQVEMTKEYKPQDC